MYYFISVMDFSVNEHQGLKMNSFLPLSKAEIISLSSINLNTKALSPCKETITFSFGFHAFVAAIWTEEKESQWPTKEPISNFSHSLMFYL